MGFEKGVAPLGAVAGLLGFLGGTTGRIKTTGGGVGSGIDSFDPLYTDNAYIGRCTPSHSSSIGIGCGWNVSDNGLETASSEPVSGD